MENKQKNFAVTFSQLYFFIGLSLFIFIGSLPVFYSKCASLSVGIPVTLLITYFLVLAISWLKIKPNLIDTIITLLSFGFLTAIIIILVTTPGCERYYPFNPNIDTVYAENFSKEKFIEIQVNMTENEVTNILGEPLWKSDLGDKVAWSYSGDGACGNCDAAWHSFRINFSKGRVVNKNEWWGCD